MVQTYYNMSFDDDHNIGYYHSFIENIGLKFTETDQHFVNTRG